MSISIDYNAETADGKFVTRLSRLDTPVRLGQIVQTHDEDKNHLEMVVDAVDEALSLAYLRPDWTTWIDGEAASLARGLQVRPS